MAAPFQRGHLSQNARRALELLTVDPRGLAEPLLLTYGFSRKMLGGLVRTRLATEQRQTVKVRGEPAKVMRFRITDAGRQAIETGDMPKRPPPHKPLPSWNIYRAADKAEWIGSVKAANADDAIEAAAKEFKTEARRLTAVRHRVVA